MKFLEFFSFWEFLLKSFFVKRKKDFTRNLVVVGRQPHPDPNFASYVLPGRPHRLAVALSRAA